MSNNYARLSHVKAVSGHTTSDQDDLILREIEQESRFVERLTGRAFHSQIATRYFDGGGRVRLHLFNDLVSVTALTVDKLGTYTYTQALVADTDYWLHPDNETPKRAIEINPESTTISIFPDKRRSVKVVGKWGYSDDTESAGTLGAAIANGTATSVTMTAGHTVEAGDTMYVESEQFYVSTATPTTLTVTRGFNGTTGAAHDNSTAVTVRRYPPDVEEAVALLVMRNLWSKERGYEGVTAMVESFEANSRRFEVPVSYARIRALLAPYTVRAVA